MRKHIFYKYRPDSKHTEDIITSGKVFLSTAAGLNDPFECSLQEIENQLSKEDEKKMQENDVNEFLLRAIDSIVGKSSFFGLSKEETMRVIQKIKSFKDIEAASAYREEIFIKQRGYPPNNSVKMYSQLNSQLQAVGIFSMSSKHNHPLMWAHYAKNHSGICLGFKKKDNSRLSNVDHFLPIIYSDKLPGMVKEEFNILFSIFVNNETRLFTTTYYIAFSDKTMQKAITTKPTCWNYEDEWRYIEPTSGLFAWPGELSDITFGLRCNDNRKNYYIKLIDEYVPYPIRFFCMQKKRGGNELERVPF